MLNKSEFSTLAQIPVAMLCFYDQIGLLKPAYVDALTDMRYYAVDQLPQLNRIEALKHLGLGLDQIACMLQGAVSVAEIRGMLALRQADAARALIESQARLAHVEARVRAIELEDTPLAYDIVLKSTAPQWVLSTRELVPTRDALVACSETLHALLCDWLCAHGVTPLGAPAPHAINLYHDNAYVEQNLDLEAAVPIPKPKLRLVGSSQKFDRRSRAQPSAAQPTWKSPSCSRAPITVTHRELHGEVLMASGMHTGSATTLTQLIKTVIQWVAENGYTVTGPMRELHFCSGTGAHPHDRSSLIEIQLPIEVASEQTSPLTLA
jgi:DNA-binding transcriptional MerR regulator